MEWYHCACFIGWHRLHDPPQQEWEVPTGSFEETHSTNICRRYAVKVVSIENTFLLSLFNPDQEVPDACKARVLKTMKEFPSSVDIQINCCTVLSNIALSGTCTSTCQSRVVRGRQTIECGNGRHAESICMLAVSEDDVLFSRDYINPICLAMRVGLSDQSLVMHII